MRNTDVGHCDPRYEIFTDGACRRNPGPGGYAWVCRIVVGGQETSRTAGCDAEPDTTNIRMEMRAALAALSQLPETTGAIFIYSDNRVLVDGMTKWLDGWRARGWRRADKQPVANVDLWTALSAVAEGRKITWTWIKGHAGHLFNEVADGLASEAAARMDETGRRPPAARRQFQLDWMSGVAGE